MVKPSGGERDRTESTLPWTMKTGRVIDMWLEIAKLDIDKAGEEHYEAIVSSLSTPPTKRRWKLQGDGAPLPSKHSTQAILLAWLGGFLAISSVTLLAHTLSATLVLGSFGASCVLVFGFPDVPFSQPRNVFCGHVLSSFIGLICLTLFGATWWSVAIAVATAISVMMWTRTTHPPAGSNPVIIYLAKPTWNFLLFPTASGAIVLILVALLYNNLSRKSNYPKYW